MTINYTHPGDLPGDHKPKLVVVYAAGLKIYGALPYLLQRRLQARFNSSEISTGGLRMFGPSWEPNYTVVPWRRYDGQPHTPETLQALAGWLQSGKGFTWVVAAPENFHDRLDAHFFRSRPHVWQPEAAQTNPEGLLALLEKRSP